MPMTTRRQFLKQMAAASGLGLIAGPGLGGFIGTANAAGSWYMPDENAPHARAYVAFGAKSAIWWDWTADAQNAIGRIARTIAAHEPVTVLCRNSELGLAKQKCGTTNTRFIEMALDDIWVRDTGANFVTDGQGRLAAVGFNFNGWGGKQTHVHDAKVAGKMAAKAGAAFIRSKLTGEGGAIEVDGHGTGIMTESSWVNSNRNPGWTKSQVEAELKANLGLRKIIWLPGIRGMDITDGHVDFYARFVKPGVVIANLDNDSASYDYAVTRRHLEILRSATDADGRKLQVHTLPPPRTWRKTKFSQGNKDWAPGYINYFAVRGAVIAPQFGDTAADSYCRNLLAGLYPRRKIIQLNIDVIAGGGGGIHCVTGNRARL